MAEEQDEKQEELPITFNVEPRQPVNINIDTEVLTNRDVKDLQVLLTKTDEESLDALFAIVARCVKGDDFYDLPAWTMQPIVERVVEEIQTMQNRKN